MSHNPTALNRTACLYRVPQLLPLVLLLLAAYPLKGEISIELGLNGKFDANMQVSGQSRSLLSGVRETTPGDFDPVGVGSANQTADRTYLNGYVNRDPGTDNPDAVGGQGLTWFWGYDTADQIASSTDSLSFRQAGGRRVSFMEDAPDVHATDDLSFGGLEIRFLTPRSESSRIKFIFGLGYFESSTSSVEFSNYSQSYVESSYTVMDLYDISSLSAVPVAPYAGTEAGPGPIISNLPASRNVVDLVQTGNWSAVNSIKMEADVSLFDMQIAVDIQLHEGDAFSANLRPSVHLIRMKSEFLSMETLTSTLGGEIGRWQDSLEARKTIGAFGMDLVLSVKLKENIRLFGNAGFEHVTDECSFSVGGKQVQLDLDSYKIGAGLTVAF